MRILTLITLLFVSNLSFGQAFGITGGGGRATTLTSEDFTEELQFNSNKVMPLNERVVQNQSYSFTLASSGNTAGNTIYYYIQADGSSTFSFSDDFAILNSSITDGGTLTDTVTYLFGFMYDGSSVSVSVSETDAESEFSPDDLSPQYYNSTLQAFDGTTATDINIGVPSSFNTDDYEVYVWISPDDGQPSSPEGVFGTNQSTSGQIAFIQIQTNGKVFFAARGLRYQTDAAVFADGGSQPKYLNMRVVSGVPSLYVNGSLVASTISADETPAAAITADSFYGARDQLGSGPVNFFNGDGHHLWIYTGALSGGDRTNMEDFYGAL